MTALSDFASVFLLHLPVCCLDWILPVDVDDSKAKCRYCNRVLNARYLQLLRHSLSNKHLCNAAAAASISLPVDIDGCEVSEQPAVEDSKLIAGVDNEDDGDVLADEAADVEQLDADAAATSISFITDNESGGVKKVGCWLI